MTDAFDIYLQLNVKNENLEQLLSSYSDLEASIKIMKTISKIANQF